MSIEGVLNSVDFDEFDKYYSRSTVQNASALDGFHKMIFVQDTACHTFTKTAIVHAQSSHLDHKIKNVAPCQNKEIKPMDKGGSVSLDASISWGGSGGTTASVGISAEVHDDNGNQVEVSVEQNSDGEGSASISASHDSDK